MCTQCCSINEAGCSIWAVNPHPLQSFTYASNLAGTRAVNKVMIVSCTVVQCGGLGDPPNGEVSLDGVVFGSQATYNCSAGYNLFGDATRSCEADGRWSGSQPACEGNQHLYYIFTSAKKL